MDKIGKEKKWFSIEREFGENFEKTQTEQGELWKTRERTMENLRDDHQLEEHQDKNRIWKHLEVRLFNFLT